MSYPVRCECGQIQQVSTGSAGSRVACSCGREVTVPSLSELRREAGEASVSPELIIDSMLREGELPENKFCVECHAETDHIREFDVVCERMETERANPGFGYFVLIFLSGLILSLFALIAALFASGCREERQFGRDVAFRLPLRICPICAGKRKKADYRELLCRVPVFAHLLTKYPHATIAAG